MISVKHFKENSWSYIKFSNNICWENYIFRGHKTALSFHRYVILILAITYAGRTIYLEAEDGDDLEGWIKALNDASKITVSKQYFIHKKALYELNAFKVLS